MSILTHFKAIIEWHKKHQTLVSKNLRPPLAPEKFDKLAKELPYALPVELKALYGLHDGLKDNAPLFNSFTFFPLKDAIAEYELACELEEERQDSDEQDPQAIFWKPSWFPIFGFQGDFYLLDAAQGMTSPIYYRTGTEPAIVWYDSLDRMIRTIRACFDQGAYFYDDDEIFAEDHDKANAIREQLNRKSARLQSESQEPQRQEIDEQPDGTKRLTTWYNDEHYTEQFFGKDQRKIGQAEYYQGELLRRDSYVYPSRNEVEITSENMLGMVMTTKTFGKIKPDGSVEPLRIQTFMQDQLVYDQDLTKQDDDDDEDWDEDDED